MSCYAALALAFGAVFAVAAPAGVDTRATDLWQPSVGSTWQIILSDALDASSPLTPDVDIFDIDLFDTDEDTIAQLHQKNKKVICYFSAGSYEPYRDDSDQFTDADMGSVMDGWPDEKWLNTNSANVRNIMSNRIKLAADKKCDGIDPDNVDGYGNDSGLDLTEDTALDYVSFLQSTAASHGLSTGLKNAAEIVDRAKDFVQFSVNEQCHDYDECGSFSPFISAGKPVFNIEYPDSAPSVNARVLADACATKSSNALGFSTIVKTEDLDGWVQQCNGQKATTATLSKKKH